MVSPSTSTWLPTTARLPASTASDWSRPGSTVTGNMSTLTTLRTPGSRSKRRYRLRGAASGEQVPQWFPFRQLERPPQAVAQLRLWVDAKPPEDRRRQVAGRDRVGGRVGAEAVAGTVDHAAADAAAGQHGAVAVRPVGAAGVLGDVGP